VIVVALGERRARRGEFQPVQRALACQRLGDLPLARQHGQQRIAAQLFVIVQVLVAQRHPIDALRQHLLEFVLDALWITGIAEAVGHTLQQPDLAIGLAQQQSAAVGGLPVTVEPPHYLPRKVCFKWELRLATLCHEKGRLPSDTNYALNNAVMPEKAAFFYFNPPSRFTSGEKSGLAVRLRMTRSRPSQET
jgi:hypothetical protein